jgi:hypothetical protein
MSRRSTLRIVARQDAKRQEPRQRSLGRFVTEHPVASAATAVGATVVAGVGVRIVGGILHKRAERAKAEAERAKAEAERAKAEAERAKAEAERAKAEAEKLTRALESERSDKANADARARTVRVFAPLQRSEISADATLTLISNLGLASSTITIPQSDRSNWRVEHGTAALRAEQPEPTFVVQNGETVYDLRIAESITTWMGALPAETAWTQIVVIVETESAHQWDESYECDYKEQKITFTSYAEEYFGALVYAPESVVLVDGDPFSYACTLVHEAPASPEPEEEEEILKSDYCAGTSGRKLRAESMYVCHRKVLAFARAEKLRKKGAAHEIDGEFSRVFVTSDVHADLRKFVQILRACGLVSIGKHGHGDIYGGDGKNQNIYEIAWEVRWEAESTLLVICGDLVDGFRSGVGTGDARGSYEFLLHCLLFNLRIQARAKGSEVQFTIGNHDSSTVTAFPVGYILGEKFVETFHLNFAPSGCTVRLAKERRRNGGWVEMFRRRDMLMPFYACSPYIMLTFGRMAFVHGGFVDEKKEQKKNIYEDALGRQRLLNNAPLDKDTDLVRFFAPTMSSSSETDAMWVRGYAKSGHERACDPANAAHQQFKLIAVGHCVTHSEAYATSYEGGQCDHHGTKRGEKGCVVTRECKNGPLIALVDTGMSAALGGFPSQNEARGVGMLLLDKKKAVKHVDPIRVVEGYNVYRIRALESTCLIGPDGTAAKHEIRASFGSPSGRPYV